MSSSVLTSLTVVATSSARSPKIAAAPTTELVSWMASATQTPNWSCVISR